MKFHTRGSGFRGSGFSPAAGQTNSRSNRKRNLWTSNIERPTSNVEYRWRYALSFLFKRNAECWSNYFRMFNRLSQFLKLTVWQKAHDRQNSLFDVGRSMFDVQCSFFLWYSWLKFHTRGSGFRVPRFWVPRFWVQPSRWPEKRPVRSNKKLNLYTRANYKLQAPNYK